MIKIGTSNEEGIALCTAISEHFIATKVFVLLSTHFLDLANLDGLYSNVAKWKLHFFDLFVYFVVNVQWLSQLSFWFPNHWFKCRWFVEFNIKPRFTTWTVSRPVIRYAFCFCYLKLSVKLLYLYFFFCCSGFEIAALSSMPNEVIVRAKELAAEIRQKRQVSYLNNWNYFCCLLWCVVCVFF